MRAGLGSGAAQAPPGLVDAVARAGQGAPVGVGGEEAPAAELLVGGELVHPVDGRHAEAGTLAGQEQLVGRLGRHPLRQVQLDQVRVLPALGGGGEHVERGPLGRAHQLDQAPPLGVLHADELQEPVAALVDAPGHDVAHADPGGVVAQERGRGRRRLGHPGGSREAGEVHVVADAAAPGPVDSGQEGGGGHGGGEQRGVVPGRLERRLVEVGGGAGREEPPAAGVHHGELAGRVVGPGAAVAVGGAGAHDQARVAVEQLAGVDAGGGGRGRPEVVDEQVGAVQQPAPSRRRRPTGTACWCSASGAPRRAGRGPGRGPGVPAG